MNWAWKIPLRPNVKFVLLSLADAADDEGLCWPSIPTLAQKSGINERSVQRIIAQLKAAKLITVAPRFRKDGSPTSNLYQLDLTRTGGDNFSPPAQPPAKCHHLVSSCPPPGDTASPPGGTSVTQTTTEPTIESSQPLQQSCSGGNSSLLIFPKQLQQQETQQAERYVSAFPPKLAQELLDELAGRLNSQAIRGSPLSYLRTLCNRARTGAFSPEIAIRVATIRQNEAERIAKLSAPSINHSTHTKDPKQEIANLYQAVNKSKNRSSDKQP